MIEHLKKAYPAITDVKVAGLWWKACSVLKPDFYVEYLEDNPWIHQPFERYDAMGIDALRLKHAVTVKK